MEEDPLVSVDPFPCSMKEARSSDLGRARCHIMAAGFVGPQSPTRYTPTSLCVGLGCHFSHQERLSGTIVPVVLNLTSGGDSPGALWAVWCGWLGKEN